LLGLFVASPIGDIGLRLKYNVGQYNLQAYKLVGVLGNEIPTKGIRSCNPKCKVCITLFALLLIPSSLG
jgi:hypothetical protein